MKITSIEPQRNKNRVNIYVDNIFSIGIDEELRYKYKLEIGMEVNDAFIKEVLEAEERNKVLNHALNLLSYRQRSENEIYTALKRKGFEDSHIEYAMNYCRENRYLDDKDFAQSFIKDKTNLNKLGPKRIRYELILKGISKDIIDELLIVDYEEQYEIAMEIALKKLKSYKNDDYNSIYRKLSGFLQRKGYSYDIISKVVKDILKD
ncbi:regulatory protein RecX [Tissierella praeacuta]|uniref:Regulatory protein RecX n=1 Tax=Tissierella praeacuta DSM 18095 TaxID=1123404 RepID=A0A1M4S5C9_9FIRM|nr:RecX family transcriptional regulator [Tissierella praeacuta]MBU5257031.1 RecX family transcriptional regulator [Tissierella praeacuta]TCU71601.1 regulatory protein [Tissierella praeacuta]SHE27389.1 regulatory protein [Tissierella praeacuta DSM 18095]SUP00879.1 Regulatory protein recX [Tissierella praeacuta]